MIRRAVVRNLMCDGVMPHSDSRRAAVYPGVAAAERRLFGWHPLPGHISLERSQQNATSLGFFQGINSEVAKDEF